MHEVDEEKKTFLTDQGLYCYKVGPFGLKHMIATFQRLVNKVFKPLIGKIIEVYIDDMMTKSLKDEDHVQQLGETLSLLKKCIIKLNSTKYVFGVKLGMFNKEISCIEHFYFKSY